MLVAANHLPAHRSWGLGRLDNRQSSSCESGTTLRASVTRHGRMLLDGFRAQGAGETPVLKIRSYSCEPGVKYWRRREGTLGERGGG